MNTQPNIRPPVGSLAEYMQQITEITCEARNNPTQVLFYRGHADNTWKLEPTVYRIHPDGKSYRGVEFQLYQEMLRRSPQAFQDCNTTFERLVKMQHYGLPTRLLDLTQSPLVALYFACCEKNKNDMSNGKVIILKMNKDMIFSKDLLPLSIFSEFEYEFFFNDLLNNILYEYIDKSIKLNKEILDKIKEHKEKFEKYVTKINNFSKITTSEATSAKNNNELYKIILTKLYLFNKYTQHILKFCEKKENIVLMHHLFDINREISSKIALKYKLDIRKFISIIHFLKFYSREIIISPPLNNERIQRQRGAFICFPRYHYREKKYGFPTEHITIAADKKQAILDELKTMGITRAYLFPELDVQADDIKNNLFPRS